jgi:hypothetical protein
MDLSKFEGIDWDDEDDAEGNLVHCMRPGRLGASAQVIVFEVLSEDPAEFKMKVRTAAFAVVGPDRSTSTMWVILLDISHKRGDYLRPVTGWTAGANARLEWQRRRRG